MAVIKNLMVRVGADFSGLKGASDRTKSAFRTLRDEVKKTQRQVDDFSSNTKRAFSMLKTALVALGIGKIIKDSVTEAMGVESAIQQIKRIMGESSNQFLKWANTTALAFNMSKSDALKYGSVYGNLIAGFSKSNEETLQYTQELLKASAVVASGTGRTMQDVMERIRSGLLGNTEAIEDLGIYAQVGMIKSTDAFKKFANGKSWDQLDYNTQQQIRLFSILEQATTKFGGEINKNTNASQQQFIAQLKNIQLSLGQAFLPIYQAVLPALISLASTLSSVMGTIAQFSQALFGTVQNAQTKVVSAQSEAVDSLGDAYVSAGKKAKGALSGFDQLNIIGTTESGGGSATGTNSKKEENSKQDPQVDTLSKKITTMADSVKKALEPLSKISLLSLNDSFVKLRTALQPFTQTLFAGLKWFWDNILVPFATWTIEDAIPSFINLLAGAFDVINPLIEFFTPFGQMFVESFLIPIASWTGGAVVSTLDSLGKSLETIGNWMSNNQEIISNSALAVGLFFGAWKLTELMAFIQMSGGLPAAFFNLIAPIATFTLELIKNTAAMIASKLETIALKLMYAKDFIVSIAGATLKIAGQTIAWIANTTQMIAAKVAMAATTAGQWLLNAALNANPIGVIILLIAALVAGFILLWNNNEGFRNFVIDMWEKIKIAFTTAITTIKSFLVSMGNTFVELMKKFLDSPLGQYFTDQIDNAKKAFEGIIKFIKGVFSGDWKMAWDGIKDIFTGIFDGVKTYFKLFINAIIDGINSMIRGFNKINIKMPDSPLGKGFSVGFAIPEIPRLATGGLAYGMTTAIVGDNFGASSDPEVISPLSKLKDYMKPDNRELIESILMVVDAVQSLNLTASLDGYSLTKGLVPYSEKQNNQVGKKLFTIGGA